LNPIQDTSIPSVPEAEQDTYAYSLAEIKSMLAVLPEPARTIVLTAAFTGLRKSELRGLTWGSYNGELLSVDRSVWNRTVSEPKTKRSRSPIPVVRPLAEALEAHRLRAGILAQATLPIFQAGNGQPLNLDNIARRVIISALSLAPFARCKRMNTCPMVTHSSAIRIFRYGTAGTHFAAASQPICTRSALRTKTYKPSSVTATSDSR
jgi:integrase